MDQNLRNQYRATLRKMLEACGSKFVIVQFIKQDGSLRTMLIQHAATKFRVKGENAPEHKQRAAETRTENHPELFNTYDVDRRAIRSINLDHVITVRSMGRELYAAPQGFVESWFQAA